jgi:hypothetical protein
MLALFFIAALGAAEHPAVRIISLLEGLQAKVKEEGQAEAVQYAAFSTWCKDLTSAKKSAIATASEEISVAEAAITALTADISQLETDIATITTEITHDEARRAEADSQRETDNGLYIDAKADLDATITAIGDAIAALEAATPAKLLEVSQTPVVKKALALAAIYAPKVESVKAKAFLQKEEPIYAPEVGRNMSEAPVYESKTGTVIDLLKQLGDKFNATRTEAVAAERNAANAQTLSDAAMEDEIQAGQTAKSTKESLEAQKGQDLAGQQTDLSDAQNDRAGAKSVLDSTEATCRTRQGEWEERGERRAGELKAMAEAVEVLHKITGTRDPADKGISFFQKQSDPRAQIVNLLRKAASKTQAKELTKLADQLAKLSEQPLGSGVFDQIKNMIQKMIFHLMSEQTDEDNHKNWCDTELTKTNVSAEDKETRRDALQAEIDALTAEINTLGQDIATNTKDIATLESQIEFNTAQRQEEKAENAATVKDSQDAQTAIANAVAVLTDFYKSTGAVAKEAWEFAQLKTARRVQAKEEPIADPQEPELWTGHDDGGSYSAVDGGTNVIGLLQTIASDFASMEAQAKSDETTQQDEHDSWLTTAHQDKATLEKDNEMKSSRKETQKAKLVGKNDDFAHNKKELEATLQYLSDLQPACVNGDSTYAERKASRTAEIDALKEAQGILQNAFNADEEK